MNKKGQICNTLSVSPVTDTGCIGECQTGEFYRVILAIHDKKDAIMCPGLATIQCDTLKLIKTNQYDDNNFHTLNLTPLRNPLKCTL